MEEMHNIHKQNTCGTTGGWLSSLLAVASLRQPKAAVRKTSPRVSKTDRLVITPWSGRSLNDWSA